MSSKILITANILILIFSINLFADKKESADFYVSPAGNDNWSGHLPAANPDHNDGPFATLERARHAIVELKSFTHAPIYNGNVTVYICGGVYELTRTFKLSWEDSGNIKSHIVYRPYKEQTVYIRGGKQINGFKPVEDPAILSRLDKSSQDKIMQVDLKAQGITSFGQFKAAGYSLHIQPTALEIFFKGKPMQIARYPNKGWLQIAEVPQTGKTLAYTGLPYTFALRDGIPAGRHYGRFKYSDDRPNRWAKADDIWLHGFWSWDCYDSYVKVEQINPQQKEIHTCEPHGILGYSKNQRYYALNILEELDEPGEYYLDRESGILYFWPPSPIEKGDAFVSILEEPLVLIDHASYITMEGIIFEYCRANAIEIRGGTENKIAGCTIRNIGNTGVVLSDGTKNGVIGCDICQTGDDGIRLGGGVRETLTPGDNYATNNHIHHFGRINYTYRPGIDISGVGNLIAHNLIHDGPHSGIFLSGNEHIIEFNELHTLARETKDVGAFYMWHDWTQRGNIVRYNYFHHLSRPDSFCMAVYLDNWTSGTIVQGNIFYKADRAVWINGGRNNLIENNIFIECEPSVFIGALGSTWARFYFDGTVNTLLVGMDNMNYSKPPYSVKYPELLTLYKDEPAIPKYNSIIRNVSYGGKWLEMQDGLDFSIVMVKENVIADPNLCTWYMQKKAFYEQKPVDFKFGDNEITRSLQKNENVLISGDPGFVDLQKGNFHLKEDCAAFKLGFKQIPIEKIGLYKDMYRDNVCETTVQNQ